MADLHESVRSLLNSELRHAVLYQVLVNCLESNAFLLQLLLNEERHRQRARDEVRSLAPDRVVEACQQLLPAAQEQIVETHCKVFGAEFVQQVAQEFGEVTDFEDLLQEDQ
jgi:hypothetical protein